MNFYKSDIKDLFRRLRILYIHLRQSSCPPILLPEGTVVIISPHPDDETFGCSGLVQRLLQQGREVHIVILTGGEGSHKQCCDVSAEELSDTRRELAMSINHSVGVRNLHFLNYPDGGIRQSQGETNNLKALLEQVNPHCVFVPHWGEGWPDHVNAAKIVKSLVSEKVEVYEYCVWLWYYNVWHLDWKNARVLRMTEEEHRQKNKSIDGYVTPLAPCGNPWSGVLPTLLIKALKHHQELYFKIR